MPFYNITVTLTRKFVRTTPRNVVAVQITTETEGATLEDAFMLAVLGAARLNVFPQEEIYGVAVELDHDGKRAWGWKLEGKDGFNEWEDYYPLDNEGYQPLYLTEHEARAAARKRLDELNVSQPSAGGQGGIQDRVYIVHPGGRRERIT